MRLLDMLWGVTWTWIASRDPWMRPEFSEPARSTRRRNQPGRRAPKRWGSNPNACPANDRQGRTALEPHRIAPLPSHTGCTRAWCAAGVPSPPISNPGNYPVRRSLSIWRDRVWGSREERPGASKAWGGRLPGKGTTRNGGSLLDQVFRSGPEVAIGTSAPPRSTGEECSHGALRVKRAEPIFPSFGKVLACAPIRNDPRQGMGHPSGQPCACSPATPNGPSRG